MIWKEQNFLTSIFTSFTLVLPLPLLDDLPTPDTLLTNINISSYDVFQILCTLDPTKAPEIDYFSPVIFKSCAGFLGQFIICYL